MRDGAEFHALDTGFRYVFDAVAREWREQAASVTGHVRRLDATWQRPDDATDYAGGDIVGVPLHFNLHNPAGSYIVDGLVTTDRPAWEVEMRAHLFQDHVSADAVADDNAALSFSAVLRNLYLGFIDVETTATRGNFASGRFDPAALPHAVVAGHGEIRGSTTSSPSRRSTPSPTRRSASISVVLEVLEAQTPSAEQRFWLELLLDG